MSWSEFLMVLFSQVMAPLLVLLLTGLGRALELRLMCGAAVAGAPPLKIYQQMLPFRSGRGVDIAPTKS